MNHREIDGEFAPEGTSIQSSSTANGHKTSSLSNHHSSLHVQSRVTPLQSHHTLAILLTKTCSPVDPLEHPDGPSPHSLLAPEASPALCFSQQWCAKLINSCRQSLPKCPPFKTKPDPPGRKICCVNIRPAHHATGHAGLPHSEKAAKHSPTRNHC